MIRLFSMFSGYGGAEFALKKAKIPFEVVGFSEVDKYAIQCYQQNHNGKNFGDCTKINPDDIPDFDLLTGGFPCQAFSMAGNRKGFDDTRGTLFRDIIRIAEAKKPKWMLLENVKGLVNHDGGHTLNVILREIKRIGYDVRWKVLNSKEHGIPQNRERIWIVCNRDGFEPFKPIFPNTEPLTIFIKDILEEKVDKKYNLSKKMIEGIKNSNFMERKPMNINKHSKTLKVGGDVPCIVHCTQQRNPDRPSLKENPNAGGSGHICKTDGTTYCIDTRNTQAIEKEEEWRRLTPKECFRLMGFSDDEINLKDLSDTQCYKLAGNGWEINVVSKIFKNLFGDLNDSQK